MLGRAWYHQQQVDLGRKIQVSINATWKETVYFPATHSCQGERELHM